MRNLIIVALMVACAVTVAAAATPHVITFGKPLPVKLFLGTNEDKSIDLKIRSLYVDGKLKEFTTGEPHDITDRIFVVRRAYRLNDWLPEDEGTNHKWKWQRGGWLTVDRETGRVSQLTLPLFDPFYSVASWYRDYVAYCGLNDDATKLYAVVAQIGTKKPVLRREIGAANNGDLPDSECGMPDWQRSPTRVTFAPMNGQKMTFAIKGHAADVAVDASEGEEK
jgi:hypothetical protein